MKGVIQQLEITANTHVPAPFCANDAPSLYYETEGEITVSGDESEEKIVR